MKKLECSDHEARKQYFSVFMLISKAVDATFSHKGVFEGNNAFCMDTNWSKIKRNCTARYFVVSGIMFVLKDC